MIPTVLLCVLRLCFTCYLYISLFCYVPPVCLFGIFVLWKVSLQDVTVMLGVPSVCLASFWTGCLGTFGLV